MSIFLNFNVLLGIRCRYTKSEWSLVFKAQLVLKTLRIRPFHKISEIELGYIVYNKVNSSIGEDTTIN